jgi:hypothetical protein
MFLMVSHMPMCRKMLPQAFVIFAEIEGTSPVGQGKD